MGIKRKPPGRPGQIWSPDGLHNVRIMRRTNGCKGCLYENCLYLCPGIQTKEGKKINCEIHNGGIIFVRP